MQDTQKPASFKAEFRRFWNRLDHYQQLNILSLSLIFLALILGVSVINQGQLRQLYIMAASQQNVLGVSDEASAQATVYQERAACELSCTPPSVLDEDACSCVFPLIPRNPLINATK